MHHTHHLASYAAVSQIVRRNASERAWQLGRRAKGPRRADDAPNSGTRIHLFGRVPGSEGAVR